VTPAGKAISSETMNAAALIWAVTLIRGLISSVTGRRVLIEVPKSPCAARPSHITYCTGIDRSSPNSCRYASTTSGSICACPSLNPNIAETGSPGSSSTSA
jgi:hypothetical protein